MVIFLLPGASTMAHSRKYNAMTCLAYVGARNQMVPVSPVPRYAVLLTAQNVSMFQINKKLFLLLTTICMIYDLMIIKFI